MKTIELKAVVGPDRCLVVQLPPDIPPGEHHVVLVIDRVTDAVPPRAPLSLPLLPVESWPAELSLRREDMYGDWGR